MSNSSQLTTGDKLYIALDKPAPSHGVGVSAPLGMLAGFGAGYGVHSLVKEVGFPSNDQYESATSEVDVAKSQIDELEQVQTSLTQNDIEGGRAEVDSKIEDLQTEILVSESKIPSDYNPHLEGLVSGGSALIVGIFTTVAIFKGISARARKAREKVNQTDEPGTYGGGSEM